MSESVITQCPHCSTGFRVNDTQLNAANGTACYGIYPKIFNALQHQVSGAPCANAPSAVEAEPAATPPPAPSIATVTPATPSAARPHDETLWTHDDLDLGSFNLDEELAKLGELELNQEFSSIEKAPRPAEGLLARRDDERDPHDECWAETLIAGAEPVQLTYGNPHQEPSLGESLAEERISFVPLRRAEDPSELRPSLDGDDDDESSPGKRRYGLNALDEDGEESTEGQSIAPLGSVREPDEVPVESLGRLRDEPLRLTWGKPRYR